jgi:predicted RNase H-like nuclease (RuvC/YqgF family)
MKQRTHLDWLNEINRLQGRSQVAVRLEKEQKLIERIRELERDNKKLKNDVENKDRKIKYTNSQIKTMNKEKEKNKR